MHSTFDAQCIRARQQRCAAPDSSELRGEAFFRGSLVVRELSPRGRRVCRTEGSGATPSSFRTGGGVVFGEESGATGTVAEFPADSFPTGSSGDARSGVVATIVSTRLPRRRRTTHANVMGQEQPDFSPPAASSLVSPGGRGSQRQEGASPSGWGVRHDGAKARVGAAGGARS